MSPKYVDIPTSIPYDEYKRRFITRVQEKTGLDEDESAAVWEGCTFAEHVEGFADDPEGSADEELSYWDDDGD